MAVENNLIALNAHISSVAPSHKEGGYSRVRTSGETGDSKSKYEDPITKKLKQAETSHALTDGSDVALLGAQSSDDKHAPAVPSNDASKAAGAYDTAANKSDSDKGSIISDGEPPYARAAREIREYQEERAEKSSEKREENEQRALRILNERQRNGEAAE